MWGDEWHEGHIWATEQWQKKRGENVEGVVIKFKVFDHETGKYVMKEQWFMNESKKFKLKWKRRKISKMSNQ